MKKAYYLFVSLILWAPLLFGQVKLTATASKTNVVVGEHFKLDFSVNADANHFTPPNFSDFQIVSGPDLSTNTINNNGNKSIEVTYSYILAAKNEGVFDIGAASVIIDGQQYLSNSLRIEVKIRSSTGKQQIDLLDPSEILDSAQNAPIDTKYLSKQIFVKVETDKTQNYVGEPIKITYKLYNRVNIVRDKIDKTPTLKDFKILLINGPNPQKNPSTIGWVNGLIYHVTIIKQILVSPERAGYFIIPPLSMTTTLMIHEAGTSDHLFNNYDQVYYELKSDPVIIHAIYQPLK